MKLPLISLIIPMYNAEKYIVECLESATNQTYENLEVIVVDDNSSDDSAIVVKSYIEKNNNILYVKTKNGNAAKTRRDGLKSATGSLVCFLDSDDVLDKRYVEYLHRALVSSGADISACGIQTFSGEFVGTQSDREQVVKDEVRVIDSNVRSFVDHYHITEDNNLTLQTVPCKLFKKELFVNIDYDVLNTNIFEDNFIMAQILRRVKNVAIIDETLYWYRQSEGTTSGGTVLTKVNNGEATLNAVEFFNYVVIEYCKKMLGDDPAFDRLKAAEFFNYAKMVPDLIVRKNYLEERVKLDSEELEHLSMRLGETEARVQSALNSNAYKIGTVFVAPARKILSVLKGKER